MLRIHPRTVAAFEADVLADQRRRFVEWLHAHRATVGEVPPGAAMQVLEEARAEATAEGADADEQLFVFAAARGMMPAMTGPQYLLVMDVVFSSDNDIVRTTRLAAIKGGQLG